MIVGVPTLSLARATLRIVGDEVEPAHLTQLLGTSPSTAYAKGAILRSKRGADRVAPTGFWSLEAPDSSPADLNEQVMGLLSALPADPAVWQTLTSRYEVDIFCGWFMEQWNEGTEIAAATLAAVGSRGIDLIFDLWDGRDD